MRGITLALAAVALVALAGTASAHYLVEQDTPAGTVCALNFEHIIEGMQGQDPDLVLHGVVALDCE